MLLSERSTKTRNGSKNGDFTAVPLKMFAQQDNDYCPVEMFKLYLSKRPLDLQNDPKSRFYLRPLNTPTGDTWFSHQPVGKNKLGVMMKCLATKAELIGRKVNQPPRKTFASTLLQSDRPNTEVAQLGGWKSVSTLTHYNVPSMKQQSSASKLLSEAILPDNNNNAINIGESAICSNVEEDSNVVFDNDKELTDIQHNDSCNFDVAFKR